MSGNRAKSALPSRGIINNHVNSPITLVSYKSPTTSPYLQPPSKQAASPPHLTSETVNSHNSQLEQYQKQLAIKDQDITLLRNLLGEQAKAKSSASHDSAASKETLVLKKQLDEANQARSWLQAELASSRAGIDGLQAEVKAREKKVLDERNAAIQRCKQLESELLIAKARKDQSDEIRNLSKQLESDRAHHQRLRIEEEEVWRSRLSTVENKLYNAEARLRLMSTEKECQTEEMLRSSLKKEEESISLRGQLEGARSEAQELRVANSKDRKALEDKMDASLSELSIVKQRLALFEGRSRSLEAEVKAGSEREEKLKRRVHEAESSSSSLQTLLNEAERKARESERLRMESDRLKSSNQDLERQRMADEWEGRVKAEVTRRQEAELSRQQGRREFDAYRDEAESSLRASEIEEKKLRSEINLIQSHLADKANQVLDLEQRLAEERRKWSMSYDGLDAERKRLEDEWKKVLALKSEVQREAESVHAMGVLSSARTLRFDLSSMSRGPGGGDGVSTPSHSRPQSAMGSAPDSNHATAQRLGGLVRELQEQVSSQNREIEELKRQAVAQASGGLDDEEAREGEITRLKGLNSELHRLCDRLQRDGAAKSKLAEDLASRLSDQEREISSQRSRAQSLTLDKIEFQRLSADQDELRRQLEAARMTIHQFTGKLDGAERTIVGQDELISTLKARLRESEMEPTRGGQHAASSIRPPRIPSASPSRHASKQAWEQSASGPQFGGTVSRRDFALGSPTESSTLTRPESASSSSPLRPSGALLSNSSSFTYGPGGWGGVAGGGNNLPPASPPSSLDRSASGRARNSKQTFLML